MCEWTHQIWFVVLAICIIYVLHAQIFSMAVFIYLYLLFFFQVDHCFDIFVSRLCDNIFTYYKSWAARYAFFSLAWLWVPLKLYWTKPFLFDVKKFSELLDPSFLFALDNGEKYSIQPIRFTALLKMTRVKVKIIFFYMRLKEFSQFWNILFL